MALSQEILQKIENATEHVTNRALARELGVSEFTVSRYRRRLPFKARVKGGDDAGMTVTISRNEIIAHVLSRIDTTKLIEVIKGN